LRALRKRLRLRIADLESAESCNPEKSLGTRERDSMLKLIIGTAIKGAC
jgi:hypothetical protein